MTEEQFKLLMEKLDKIYGTLETMDSRLYCLELCIKSGKQDALVVVNREATQ
jgi:hypothetical protein